MAKIFQISVLSFYRNSVNVMRPLYRSVNDKPVTFLQMFKISLD